MTKSPIPDPLNRRHLVEEAQSPAQALAIAEAYLAEGRSIEALDFLCQAEASEKIAELRREAVETGDAFLLRAVARATQEPPEASEWAALARAAEAAGKEIYSADARRQAERSQE